jgi:hypothetical protein
MPPPVVRTDMLLEDKIAVTMEPQARLAEP